MDPLTLAICAGSALLAVVAAVPAVSHPRVAVIIAALVSAILVASLAIRWGIEAARYVPDTGPSRLARYGVEQLSSAIKKSPRNLVVIEGGSYPARGVDPKVLHDALSKLGYRTMIVQLALGAANHFERYQMQAEILKNVSIDTLPKRSNLVFLAETQVDYDTQPLAQLFKNLDTNRAYHYLTPVNGALALWAGRGDYGSLKAPIWTVFRHALVNAFNVGVLSRLVPWREIKSKSGFIRTKGRPEFRFAGLSEVTMALEAPAPDLPEFPWLFQIRESRLKRLWGKRLDHWVYFSLPATKGRATLWARKFCERTPEMCIAASDVNLIEQLDDAKMWHDAGHLNSRGAVVYSKWLAQRLAESGVLKK